MRWAEFRQRADHAPADVYRHPRLNCEYVPVHPFGDEPKVLRRLGLRPEDCVRVDAWWGISGDATLLSCHAEEGFGAPEYRAKGTPHAEQWVYLSVKLDAPYVTRSHIEDAMEFFVLLGFPEDNRFAMRPGSAPLIFRPRLPLRL